MNVTDDKQRMINFCKGKEIETLQFDGDRKIILNFKDNTHISFYVYHDYYNWKGKKIIKLQNQIKKVNLLLRRIYNIIEMSHLNDHKMVHYYCTKFHFPRKLGDDIFNYLQSKDEYFKNIVIKRQKRYRKKLKLKNLNVKK